MAHYSNPATKGPDRQSGPFAIYVPCKGRHVPSTHRSGAKPAPSYNGTSRPLTTGATSNDQQPSWQTPGPDGNAHQNAARRSPSATATSAHCRRS